MCTLHILPTFVGQFYTAWVKWHAHKEERKNVTRTWVQMNDVSFDSPLHNGEIKEILSQG